MKSEKKTFKPNIEIGRTQKKLVIIKRLRLVRLISMHANSLSILRIMILVITVWLIWSFSIHSYSIIKDIRNSDVKHEATGNIQANQSSPKEDTNKIKPSCNLYNPSQLYEHKRRKVVDNIEELWFYIQSELMRIKNSKEGVNIERIMSVTSEYKRSLMHDMEELGRNDNHDHWRNQENNYLGELMQARLNHIQNPVDCNTAKKVLCHIHYACGFGCQLHHVTYCLLIAYATKRTLILDSDSWNYMARGNWDSVFDSLSTTCTSSEGSSRSIWPEVDDNSQIIELRHQTYSLSSPNYLPKSVPRDIHSRLTHGEPFVWWIGQLVKYIFRPNKKVQDTLDKHRESIEFDHPIVAIHIRRTDKILTEASNHSIEEYMIHVEEYYAQLEQTEKVKERKVYVATDDISAIEEIKKKYPTYKILGDKEIVHHASVEKRYSYKGLVGIISDIYFTARSDYIVCTFSSQICRIAYELMNTMHVDASMYFKSLDDIYFYAGQIDSTQTAVLKHEPYSDGQIALEIGDEIVPMGNHWNGFSKGKKIKTGEIGLYPSFKVIPRVNVHDFPTYDEVVISKEFKNT